MRFVHVGTKKKIFFCENLNRTISKRYLPMCKEFFLEDDLEIQIINSVYTDGAPTMLGKIFCVLINQDNTHLQATHFFHYRHAFVSKTLP